VIANYEKKKGHRDKKQIGYF